MNAKEVQHEADNVDATYPGIFDSETTELDLDILNDEIEKLLEEEINLEKIISMSE